MNIEAVRRFLNWLEEEGYVIGQYDAELGLFPNGNNADQWIRLFEKSDQQPRVSAVCVILHP